MSTHDWALRQFAKVYPHELYDSDPELFWSFFHEQYPEITREAMVKALEETRE